MSNNNLKGMVQDLDNHISGIGAKVESLQDVEVLLGQLRVSMDAAVYRGEEHLYHREHHRKIRMLADLMYYLMRDLTERCDKASQLYAAIHEVVVRGGLNT